MAEDRVIAIGAFYALPDGTVARTHGWDGSARLVSYALDDGRGSRSAPESEVLAGWTRRPDLADFPDARDPALPYAFDLVWDAKRRSDLPALLADPDVADEVEAAMRRHGIELDEAARERVEALKDVARLSGM